MRDTRFLGRMALAICLALLGLGFTACADDKDKPDKRPDVIYVPTPQEVVERMLDVAKVKKDDVVYDLGCGDGRIVLTAARKYGAKATGFDVDPDRIKDCMANYKKEKEEVQKLVSFEKKDIFTLDLSKASVVTLYLLPELNDKLAPQLAKMKPGSRVVTHAFEFSEYEPEQTIQHKTKDDNTYDIYFYTIPMKKKKK